MTPEEIVKAIEHGDEKHREWLREVATPLIRNSQRELRNEIELLKAKNMFLEQTMHLSKEERRIHVQTTAQYEYQRKVILKLVAKLPRPTIACSGEGCPGRAVWFGVDGDNYGAFVCRVHRTGDPEDYQTIEDRFQRENERDA